MMSHSGAYCKPTGRFRIVLLSILLIVIGFSLLNNLAINQTAAAPGLGSLDVLHAYNFAWVDQNMNSTYTTSLLNSTSSSGESNISFITTTASSSSTTSTSSNTPTTTSSTQTSTTSTTAVTISSVQTTNASSTFPPSSTSSYTQKTNTPSTTTSSASALAATSSSTQTTTSSTSSFASFTTINSAIPAVTQNDNITTTTITASATRSEKHFSLTKTLGRSTGYSISFSPPYWLCTDVSVTFTGPLVESGLFGHTLQFQYFQYSPSYPSVLNPIFTDPVLTVTSDTVNYWINYNEYASANFAYMPNIAVRVVDVTPKSNGYMPGQIFMELTNITPEGYQYCQVGSSAPIPEFQTEWMIIMVSVVLGLAFLQAHKRKVES